MKKMGIVAAFAVAILMAIGLLPALARSSEPDAAGTYTTAKCVVCHGAKAEKKFNAAMPEEEMVKVIMTGKKAEKPPNMPAYSAKGISEDQAKELITYMKSLKQ